MMEVFFRGYGQWYIRIPRVHIQKTNIIDNDDEVTGIFKLSDKDAEEYARTKSFYHIETMQPCLSPGSTFLRLVEERKIPKIDADYAWFQVKRDRIVYSPFDRRNVHIEVPAFFELIEIDKPTNTETPPKAKTNHEEPVSVCRNRLLVAILAMAIDRYGYELDNPSKNTVNHAINGLIKSLTRHSVLIDRDEIIQYLTEANDIYKCFEKDQSGDAKRKQLSSNKYTEDELSNPLKLLYVMSGYDSRKLRNDASGDNKNSIRYITSRILDIAIAKGTILDFLRKGEKLATQLTALVDSNS